MPNSSSQFHIGDSFIPPPSLSYLAPICLADPNGGGCAREQNQELTLIAGDTAVIRVHVQWDPKLGPSIIWRHADMHVTSDSPRRTLRDGNRQLVIEPMKLEDSGVYTVEVAAQISGTRYSTMTRITLNVLGMLKD
jgi:hypothetical protein